MDNYWTTCSNQKEHHHWMGVASTSGLLHSDDDNKHENHLVKLPSLNELNKKIHPKSVKSSNIGIRLPVPSHNNNKTNKQQQKNSKSTFVLAGGDTMDTTLVFQEFPLEKMDRSLLLRQHHEGAFALAGASVATATPTVADNSATRNVQTKQSSRNVRHQQHQQKQQEQTSEDDDFSIVSDAAVSPPTPTCTTTSPLETPRAQLGLSYHELERYDDDFDVNNIRYEGTSETASRRSRSRQQELTTTSANRTFSKQQLEQLQPDILSAQLNTFHQHGQWRHNDLCSTNKMKRQQPATRRRQQHEPALLPTTHDQQQLERNSEERLTLQRVCQCCFDWIEPFQEAATTGEEQDEEDDIIACTTSSRMNGSVNTTATSACQDRHEFCPDCVRRYVETWVYGGLSYPLRSTSKLSKALPCMSGNCATGYYSHSTVQRAVPGLVWKAYKHKIALVHSDRYISNSSDQQLRTTAKTKVTTRTASSKGDHFTTTVTRATSCEVVPVTRRRHRPLDKTVDSSTLMEQKYREAEEALTEAKLRRCPNCHTQFIKEEGFCNKMKCPSCKNTAICYICRKEVPLKGYDHFCRHAYDSCQQCNKCALWSNNDDTVDLVRLRRVATDIANRVWQESLLLDDSKNGNKGEIRLDVERLLRGL